MLTFDPKKVSTPKLHGLLLGAIGPRPIAFASTIDDKGNPNLSPYSFFNVFSANPPILIFSPARRVRDNSIKHTLENVEQVKEVVINVVNYNIVQQMSLSSTEYAKGVNEFEKAGLTMVKSDLVKPYRVGESPVQFECEVKEIIKLGNEGGAGNLIMAQVVKIHVNENVVDREGKIDQHKIDQVARMGGNWYTRATAGMFEVPKPLSSIGIAIDSLPKEIRESTILTGNDLGKLGNIASLPTNEEVTAFAEKNKNFSTFTLEQKHQKAKELLSQDRNTEALLLLLYNT
ncbi:flavin reductase family protein [Gangjinia marincola]|uniref:Flavin reductase family protein n=1 Tax=Gangjinia marincola TaxID=578463 RepID=A0ABP3XT92_9FLAO